MNQDYVQSHFPPMPVLDIWFAASEESRWLGPFTALVDSGADFTIAPLDLILPLQPPLVRQATLYGHWRDARIDESVTRRAHRRLAPTIRLRDGLRSSLA
jgi:hypothetical protein